MNGTPQRRDEEPQPFRLVTPDAETVGFGRILAATEPTAFETAKSPFSLNALLPIVEQIEQLLGASGPTEPVYRMVISDNAHRGLEAGTLELTGGRGGAPTMVRDAVTKRFVEGASFVELAGAARVGMPPQALVAALAVFAVYELAVQLDAVFKWVAERFADIDRKLLNLKEGQWTDSFGVAQGVMKTAEEAEAVLRDKGDIAGIVDLPGAAHQSNVAWSQAVGRLDAFLERVRPLQDQDKDKPLSATDYVRRIDKIAPFGVAGVRADVSVFAAVATSRLYVTAVRRASMDMSRLAFDQLREHLDSQAAEMGERAVALHGAVDLLAHYPFRPDPNSRGPLDRTGRAIKEQRALYDVSRLTARIVDAPWDYRLADWVEIDVRRGPRGLEAAARSVRRKKVDL